MAKSFRCKGRADGTQSQRTQEFSHFVLNEFEQLKFREKKKKIWKRITATNQQSHTHTHSLRFHGHGHGHGH